MRQIRKAQTVPLEMCVCAWDLLKEVTIIFIESESEVDQSCPTLCDPMNRSTPGLLVHHQLLEFTHTHVHSSW